MAPDVPDKERVVGRYVMRDEIAAGGMATVHIGRLLGPVGFARTVAIKRLHAHLAKDPEFVMMLLDEARLAARIRHPNVVSTLDIVVDRGELWIVMDYVEGESLSRLATSAARVGERVPLPIALSVISGALYGLHAAHEATNEEGKPLSVIHRDVSPQNIMVGVDGVARVLDFGVARAAGRLQTTREGTLKGKLAYMSPEQVRGEGLDRRSDIYAMAIVLWEMVTGRRLFVADNDAELLHKVLVYDAPPPRTLVPELPAPLDELVMRGLTRDRSGRFDTAAEMAESLQRVAFATSGDIGRWVAVTGGAALAERTRRIARLESQSSGSRGSADPPAPSTEAPAVPSTERDPPPPSTSRTSEGPASPSRVLVAPPPRAFLARTIPSPEAEPPTDPLPSPPRRLPASATVVAQVARELNAATIPDPPQIAFDAKGAIVPSGPSNASRGARLAMGGALLLALLLGVVTTRWLSPASSVAPPQDASVVAKPPPTLSPSPAPPAPVALSSQALPSMASAVPIAPSPETVSPARLPLRRPLPARPPAPGRCNPPYTTDPDGIRSPKPECL